MPAQTSPTYKPLWWPQTPPPSFPQIKHWCSGLVLPFIPPSCSDPAEWMVKYIPTPELIAYRASLLHLADLLAVPIYLQLWTRANDPGRTMFPAMNSPQISWATENLRPFQSLPNVGLILDLEMGNMGAMPPEAWSAGTCSHVKQLFTHRPSCYGWLHDLVPITGAGLLRKRRPRPAFAALLSQLNTLPAPKMKPLGFTQDTATPAGNNPIGFAKTRWKSGGLAAAPITPYDWDAWSEIPGQSGRPSPEILAKHLRTFRKAGLASCIYDRRSMLGNGTIGADAVEAARK